MQAQCHRWQPRNRKWWFSEFGRAGSIRKFPLSGRLLIVYGDVTKLEKDTWVGVRQVLDCYQTKRIFSFGKLFERMSPRARRWATKGTIRDRMASVLYCRQHLEATRPTSSTWGNALNLLRRILLSASATSCALDRA